MLTADATMRSAAGAVRLVIWGWFQSYCISLFVEKRSECVRWCSVTFWLAHSSYEPSL
jgi:hypothetical protein